MRLKEAIKHLQSAHQLEVSAHQAEVIKLQEIHKEHIEKVIRGCRDEIAAVRQGESASEAENLRYLKAPTLHSPSIQVKTVC